MKITLDIPDGFVCAFFNGVRYEDGCYQLACYQLCSDDFINGNTITLPRREKENNNDSY